MAYGYGPSVSLLQVARAYTVFARNGDMVSMTLVKRDSDPTSVRIYTPKTTALVRGMLEAAAGPEGTKAAQVRGYRVAGKSGTARKIVDGKYSMQRYRSSYVGFAPVSDPKIVVAVSIDEPTVGGYYGGAIAAPVFSALSAGVCSLWGASRRALRIHDCCWFEGARQMNAKGFQSLPPRLNRPWRGCMSACR